MSRIVITGASGFVGSAILSAARDRGHEVVGLSTRNIPGLERVDIHDPDSMAPHFRSADAVIHAAGLAHVFGPSSRDADAFVRANADAVDSVSAAAAPCERPSPGSSQFSVRVRRFQGPRSRRGCDVPSCRALCIE